MPTLPNRPELDDVIIDFAVVRCERKNQQGYRRTVHHDNEGVKKKKSLVADRLSKPHPLAINARANLSKKSASRWRGFEDVISTDVGCISISSKKSNVSRFLRFIDGFIKYLISQGHSITVEHYKTIVKINGEAYDIKFREKCNRKPRIEKSGWASNDLVPNDKLSVKLCHSYKTKEWTDGRKKIEEQIEKIIDDLEVRAQSDKEENKRIDEFWTEQRRLKAIEEEKIKALELEKKKVEMLVEEAQKWQVSNGVRAFVLRITEFGESEDLSAESKEWVNWANLVSQKLDPLRDGEEEFIQRCISER